MRKLIGPIVSVHRLVLFLSNMYQDNSEEGNATAIAETSKEKLEVLRDHRPPPNVSIIELQISYAALIRVH